MAQCCVKSCVSSIILVPKETPWVYLWLHGLGLASISSVRPIGPKETFQFDSWFYGLGMTGLCSLFGILYSLLGLGQQPNTGWSLLLLTIIKLKKKILFIIFFGRTCSSLQINVLWLQTCSLSLSLSLSLPSTLTS